MKRMSLAEVTPRDTATTSEQLEIGDVSVKQTISMYGMQADKRETSTWFCHYNGYNNYT